MVSMIVTTVVIGNRHRLRPIVVTGIIIVAGARIDRIIADISGGRTAHQ